MRFEDFLWIIPSEPRRSQTLCGLSMVIQKFNLIPYAIEENLTNCYFYDIKKLPKLDCGLQAALLCCHGLIDYGPEGEKDLRTSMTIAKANSLQSSIFCHVLDISSWVKNIAGWPGLEGGKSLSCLPSNMKAGEQPVSLSSLLWYCCNAFVTPSLSTWPEGNIVLPEKLLGRLNCEFSTGVCMCEPN